NVLAISSACRGFGERNSKACTCATVRLMPQRVPISPQCRTNRCSIGESGMLVSFPYFLLFQKLQTMATVSLVHTQDCRGQRPSRQPIQQAGGLLPRRG